MPEKSNWNLCFEDVAPPAADNFVVKIDYVSLDPAMRGWMNEGDSYLPAVELGAVMRAAAVGTVVSSANPEFLVGQCVSGSLGVQEFAVSDGRGIARIDRQGVNLPAYLGVLGMSGLTAYFGLVEVAKVTAGDTVVVSAAAGGVGSLTGQIAKILGARVIGIAGGDAKCRRLTDELGFDAAIDYRNGSVSEELALLCDSGIDVFFDNVGGDVLDAALGNLATGARVVLCGAVSQYNESVMRGPSNYMQLLVRRASMTGFVVFDYAPRFPEAIRALTDWLAQGRLVETIDMVHGIENFPDALRGLFTGDNNGKRVLKISGVSI